MHAFTTGATAIRGSSKCRPLSYDVIKILQDCFVFCCMSEPDLPGPDLSDPDLPGEDPDSKLLAELIAEFGGLEPGILAEWLNRRMPPRPLSDSEYEADGARR
jgi:hypothetical protein